MSDRLNAGVPGDRFEVEWHLASRHVEARLARAEPEPDLAALLAEGVLVLNPASPGAADDAPAPVCRDPSGARVLIRFPTDIQTLKMTRPAETLTWRMQVRDLCERSFAAGHAVTSVAPAITAGIMTSESEIGPEVKVRNRTSTGCGFCTPNSTSITESTVIRMNMNTRMGCLIQCLHQSGAILS